MNRDDTSMLNSHIHKMSRLFKTLLVFMTLFELAMLIRGLAIFNLERLKLRMYVYSYAFLLISSLITLILFFMYEKKEQYARRMVITTYVYAFCFIMWSAVVTGIDCYANGDSGIIVYVMTCIAVGGLTLIKPWVFMTYLGISGTFLIIFTAYARAWVPYSSGFYLNFAIFLVTASFVNLHNYRLSRREYEARQILKKLSYTDQLTGVYNRRRLDKHLAEDRQEPVVFVLLDIDKFKKVNDTYGHPMGDICLIRLAEILAEHFGDRVYRFGGDEFALISHLGIEETCRRIEAVDQDLERAFETFVLHISAGVYEAEAGKPASVVFSNADRALYRAKDTEGTRWVLYTEEAFSEERA